MMTWVFGAGGWAFLVLFGLILRRLLRLDGASQVVLRGWARLTPARQAAYQTTAQEVETQAAIVGISLNDAFEQRDAGSLEMAWRLVEVADCEWRRLAQNVRMLLNALAKYMPVARVVGPLRSIATHHLKSPGMVDYVRMHEVDQLLFRYKLRFQLHLEVLRHAVEVLTAEFGRTYHSGQWAEDTSERTWDHLDLCFHDFDLMTKEALLAFRTFLACLPEEQLPELAADLNALFAHRVCGAPPGRRSPESSEPAAAHRTKRAALEAG